MNTIEKLQNLALQVALNQFGNAAISIKEIMDDVCPHKCDARLAANRRTAMNLRERKPKQIWMWIGVVDDKPHFYGSLDFYNGVRHLDLFRTKKEARVCYERVEKVLVKFGSAK